MDTPGVLAVSVAAREKGCTDQTIYNALDRGDLNGIRTGKHRLVVRDEVYETWSVMETGGRLHEGYRKN